MAGLYNNQPISLLNLKRKKEDELMNSLFSNSIGSSRQGFASLMAHQPYQDSLTLGDIARPAMSMVPGAGDAIDAAQAVDAWQAGRRPEAIITAMGAALPVVSGPMLKGGAGLLGMIGSLGGKAARVSDTAKLTHMKPITASKMDPLVEKKIKDTWIRHIDEDDLDGYGLRIIPGKYEVKKGDELNPSFLWDGDIRTNELAEGVSTIQITDGWSAPDIEKAIKYLKENNYHGTQVALVKGVPTALNDYSDPGELVLKGAKVLEVLDIGKK